MASNSTSTLTMLTVPRFKISVQAKNYGNTLKMYDLSNYFGFGDNDIDFSMWEKSSVTNETNAPIEFQANKPYRLALYVRPSGHKRLQMYKLPHLVQNIKNSNTTDKKRHQSKKDASLSAIQVAGKLTNKTTNKVKSKVNIMLFDENVKPESVSKRLKKTPEKPKEEKTVILEVPSVRKNVLKEVNIRPVTKTKQNKTRRSYERKCKKNEEAEVITEPPSLEIMKELEIKKLSRTKPKKTAEEEQEFEKWASSVNSDFNDVDKFELSIAYD